MAISLRMRRVPVSDIQRGIEYLETGFEATLDNSVYDAEIASGVLCDLAEQWEFIHFILTGQNHQPADPTGLPVLGGEPLGQVGPTNRDLILQLTTAEVTEAALFLQSANFDALTQAHHEFLEQRISGDIPDFLLEEIRDGLHQLARVYSLAAEAGQAVVKRTYNDE